MLATSSPRPTAQGFCPWEAVTVTLSSRPPVDAPQRLAVCRPQERRRAPGPRGVAGRKDVCVRFLAERP